MAAIAPSVVGAVNPFDGVSIAQVSGALDAMCAAATPPVESHGGAIIENAEKRPPVDETSAAAAVREWIRAAVEYHARLRRDYDVLLLANKKKFIADRQQAAAAAATDSAASDSSAAPVPSRRRQTAVDESSQTLISGPVVAASQLPHQAAFDESDPPTTLPRSNSTRPTGFASSSGIFTACGAASSSVQAAESAESSQVNSTQPPALQQGGPPSTLPPRYQIVSARAQPHDSASVAALAPLPRGGGRRSMQMPPSDGVSSFPSRHATRPMNDHDGSPQSYGASDRLQSETTGTGHGDEGSSGGDHTSPHRYQRGGRRFDDELRGAHRGAAAAYDDGGRRHYGSPARRHHNAFQNDDGDAHHRMPPRAGHQDYGRGGYDGHEWVTVGVWTGATVAVTTAVMWLAMRRRTAI